MRLTVGGTTLQSLHGTVRFDGKSWGFKDFAFRAPGFTEVNLSGQLDNGPQGLAFTGPGENRIGRSENADGLARGPQRPAFRSKSRH